MKNLASIITVILIFTCYHLSAQEANVYKGTVVYLELGGNGAPTISLNAEHNIFIIKKWYGQARIGYGIGRNASMNTWAVPIGINVFRGFKASHVDIGAGLTYGTGLHSSTIGNDTRINKALYFVPSIAYRFQKTSGGLFFRVAYTPLLKLKEYSNPESWFQDQKANQYFGLSVGYFFGKEK